MAPREGKRKEEKKKGKRPGTGKGDFGLRPQHSAVGGKEGGRRKEREGRGLKKGKGGEDRKKKREKERAESGGLSRELA